jgi:Flp pilus assembly pilin Flp
MKANRFKRDENGATNVDTILILGLVLAIILVLVYVGTNVSGWGGQVVETVGNWWNEHVSEPITGYTEAWTGGMQNIKSHLGIETEFTLEDDLVKSMYEDDAFILTANNTDSEYLASLSEVTNRSHVYDVQAFTDVKASNRSTTTTDKVFGEGVIERVFGWSSQEENRIIIPDKLMTRIESLSGDARIHILSDTYEAYIQATGKVGTDAHYTFIIGVKG